MLSKFFINHPIFANVIAYITIIVGIVSMLNLPVAQYPNITPPTVQVTATYPGATPQILADTVALPIEQQVNSVENMLYMQSTSASNGNYKLVVTFAPGTNLAFAQVLVQNRVAAAIPKLPSEIQAQGVTTKKISTAILHVINIFSSDNRYDKLFLNNYADINQRDVLLRLPGVGDVNIFGVGEYSMRIWMNPDALKTYSLTPDDVINAIKQQNTQVAAGQIGQPPTPEAQEMQYTVTIRGRLEDTEEFENIIVKIDGNKILRIKDIGRVELGAQSVL
ncbi:MAG: efflux RND transporter permease subunit [Deltaproteobacteria bacterium]|nr:efflux RND transporter permease subunit [Deltaproteobacteria bacterium]